ncbi:MAG TPA: IS4 family transposase, partial [Candidatus Absconditabacterales bacterium]|nr:IS4 family transposase [Candidatus Absconditabacterales bacterium]
KHENTIFNELYKLLPILQFKEYAGQHKIDKYSKKFDSISLLKVLLYAQAAGKNSLRDIETALGVAHQNHLYHLGIQSVAKSTIADHNNGTNPVVFEHLFYELLRECTKYDYKHKLNIPNKIISTDATVVDLCLSMFDRAKFRKKKGAIKLHIGFDVASQLPEFINITTGKDHEVKIAKQFDYSKHPEGTIFVIDRGYFDFGLFSTIAKNKQIFVTRLKSNNKYCIMKQNPITEEGISKDLVIGPDSTTWLKSYDGDLRLIEYYDKEHDVMYEFITNTFELSAKTIAEIYKMRWQVEEFFRWIKQNLKIKTFLGTSKNAVMNQIRVAMIYYLLMQYIRIKTNTKIGLLEFSRILGELLFERMNLVDILGLKYKKINLIKNKGSPIGYGLFENTKF